MVATLLVLTGLWPWRQGWCLCWRGLVNGMATLAIGGLIQTMKPSQLPWMLGLLGGISFLFSGLDLLGFRVRFPHRASTDQP